MNVSLASEHKKLINGLVKSGRYTTDSEVIREGLKLLAAREKARKLHEDDVREKLQEAVDDLQRGDYITLDRKSAKALAEEVKRDGRRRLRARRDGK